MVQFDLQTELGPVECAISRAALEEIGPSRCFRKEDALACFAKNRALIEQRAGEKLARLPAGWAGRLTLWADDLDPAPPDGDVALDLPAQLQQAG
jgi:hypothetical protein